MFPRPLPWKPGFCVAAKISPWVHGEGGERGCRRRYLETLHLIPLTWSTAFCRTLSHLVLTLAVTFTVPPGLFITYPHSYPCLQMETQARGPFTEVMLAGCESAFPIGHRQSLGNWLCPWRNWVNGINLWSVKFWRGWKELTTHDFVLQVQEDLLVSSPTRVLQQLPQLPLTSGSLLRLVQCLESVERYWQHDILQII